MKAIVSSPPVLLQAIFASALERARETQFVRRVRQLQPDAFARTFSLFLIQHPKAALEQLADQLRISASALAQRLRDPAAALFLLSLLRHAVGRLAAASLRASTIPLLRRFNGVYLTDGTIVGLPATLAQRFKGYGGGADANDTSAAAAAKILLRLRVDTGAAAELLVEAATAPDIQLIRRLPALPEGALSIADLGFFDTQYLARLTDQKVFWLTRLPARVHVRPGASDWVARTDWLEGLERTGRTRFEGPMEVGKTDPVPMRVLAERCPVEQAARRRQKLHERARRKGTTAGARQLVLCDWWVLGTNTDGEALPARAAGELYRCRWQIELTFKRWKSLGHMAVEPSHAAIRAECELYGKLLGVVAVEWLAVQRGGLLSGHSAWRAWQLVLEFIPPLLWALAGRLNSSEVWDQLSDRLDHRPKQARRKRCPSTRQRLFAASLTA